MARPTPLGCRLASAAPGLWSRRAKRRSWSAGQRLTRHPPTRRKRPSVTSNRDRSKPHTAAASCRNALEPRQWPGDRLALGSEADGSGPARLVGPALVARGLAGGLCHRYLSVCRDQLDRIGLMRTDGVGARRPKKEERKESVKRSSGALLRETGTTSVSLCEGCCSARSRSMRGWHYRAVLCTVHKTWIEMRTLLGSCPSL